MPPTHKFLNTTVDYANIYILPISVRPSHFWDVMQRMLVVVYPRFRTAYSYKLQGPSSPRRTPGRWWILHRITHCIGSLKSLLPATSVRPYITLTALIKMTCLASLFHLWNSSDSYIQYRCHGRSIHNRHDPFCYELSLATFFLGGHEMILAHLIRWYT